MAAPVVRIDRALAWRLEAPEFAPEAGAPGELLRAALDYVARGWPVLPLHSPVGDGCSCGDAGCESIGKHPRTRDGLDDASTDPAQIRRWWARWPDANIGVRTGGKLALVDVDGPAGAATWDKLTAEHEALPSTLEALSGREGGRHVFFDPGGVKVVNDSGGKRLGTGVDVKGDRGYAVVAPSLHVSGRRYRWLDPTAPVAPMPVWLLERVQKAPQTPVRPASARQGNRPIHAAGAVLRPSGGLEAAAERFLQAATWAIETARERTRNDCLNWWSYYSGGYVAGGALERAAVEAAYTAAARRARLEEAEIPKTIASGLDAGIRDGALPRQCRGGALPARRQSSAERRKALAARWPEAELRPALALVHRTARAADWHHRGGETERRILSYVLGLAQRRGALEVEASAQWLADRLGISVGAVLEALRRLRRRGWLQLVQRGVRGKYGSIWLLQAPSAAPATLPSAETVAPGADPPTARSKSLSTCGLLELSEWRGTPSPEKKGKKEVPSREVLEGAVEGDSGLRAVCVVGTGVFGPGEEFLTPPPLSLAEAEQTGDAVDLGSLGVWARKCLELIVDGWTEPGRVYGQGRHARAFARGDAADQAVVCELVAAGRSDAEIRAVFLAWPIGSRFRQQGWAYLARAIASAERYLSERRRMERCTHAARVADGLAWEPTRGKLHRTPARVLR